MSEVNLIKPRTPSIVGSVTGFLGRMHRPGSSIDDATNAALVDITKGGYKDELVRRLSVEGYAIVNLIDWVGPDSLEMNLESSYKNFISNVTGRPPNSIQINKFPREYQIDWHTDDSGKDPTPLVFICYKLQSKRGSASMLVKGQDLYNELQTQPALLEKLRSDGISMLYRYNGRMAVRLDTSLEMKLGVDSRKELKRVLEGLTIEVKPPEGYMLIFDNLSMLHGVREMEGKKGGSNPNREIYRHFAWIPTVEPYSQITFGFLPNHTANGG